MPAIISVEEFKQDLGNLSDPSVHILYDLIHDDNDSSALSAFKKIQIFADAYASKLNKGTDSDSHVQNSSLEVRKDDSRRSEANITSATPAACDSNPSKVATVLPICSSASVSEDIELKKALRELVGSGVSAGRVGPLACVPQPLPAFLAQGFDLTRSADTTDNCASDQVDAAAGLQSTIQENKSNRNHYGPQALRPVAEDRSGSVEIASASKSVDPVAESNFPETSADMNSKTSATAAADAAASLRGLTIAENTMFGKIKFHFPFTTRETLDVSDDGADVFFDYLEMTDRTMDPFGVVCKELDRQLTYANLKAFLFGKTYAKCKADDYPDLKGALSKRAVAKYLPLGYTQISCLSIFDGDRRLTRAMALEARMVARYRSVDQRCKNDPQKQEESLKQVPNHVYLVVVALAFRN